MTVTKILSALITVGFLIGTVQVAGNVPRTPAELARRTTAARQNLDRAVGHTDASIERTEAFARIARNVRSQLRSSRELLEIQLELEASSERTGRASRRARAELVELREVFERLVERLDGVTRASERAGRAGEASADAGERLLRRLAELKSRFRKVVAQSKRLNRKARASEQEGSP